MQKLIMVALATFSTAAIAGSHYAPEVYAQTYVYRHVTYGSGYGSLAGAAASSDDKQSISCTAVKYNTSGTTQAYGTCVALDKDYNSASCYTDDAEMIGVIEAMGAQSTVGFAATGGICTSVYSTNGSQTL